MQTHDPMWDLQGLVDQPVSPDPRFSEALRQSVLTELSASPAPSLLVSLEQAGRVQRRSAPPRSHRPKAWTVLLELALVAAVLFGANAAIPGSHPQNDSYTSPTLRTKQSGQSTSLDKTQGINPAGGQNSAIESGQISAQNGVGGSNDNPGPSNTIPTPTTPTTAQGAAWGTNLGQGTAAIEPSQAASENQISWQMPAPASGSMSVSGMAVVGDRLIRVVSTRSYTRVEAYFAATGKLSWQHPVTPASGSDILCADGKTVYVSGSQGPNAAGSTQWSLIAIDAASGKERWAFDVPAMAGPPVVADGVVYIAYGDATVAAVNSADGTKQWNLTLPKQERAVALAPLAGRLYVTTRSGRILSYPLDGSIAFTDVPRPAGYDLSSPVVIDGKLVVVGTLVDTSQHMAASYTLTALDPAHDFAFLWDRGFHRPIGDPAVLDGALILTIPVGRSRDEPLDQTALLRIDPGAGATIWQSAYTSAGFSDLSYSARPQPAIVASSAEQVVYGFDLATGARLWSIEQVPAAQVIATADGVLMGTLYDGSLVSMQPNAAISASTSPPAASLPEGVRWQSTLDAGAYQTGAIAIDDTLVVRALATSAFTGVLAIDRASGQIIWRQEIAWRGPIAMSDGRIYLPGNATVTALDAATGQTRWQATVAGQALAPALAGSTLYVWSSSNLVTALDTETGAKLWQAFLPIDADDDATPSADTLTWHAPVIAGDRVVVASMGGTLYALDRATGAQRWQWGGAKGASDLRYAVAGPVVVVTSHTVTPSNPDQATPEPATHQIFGVDLAGGTTHWSQSAPVSGDAPFALVSGDAPVLIAGDTFPTGAIFTIDPATGAMRPADDATTGQVIALPLIDTSSKQALDLGQPIISAPIADGDTLFVTLQDGTLVALDRQAFTPA